MRILTCMRPSSDSIRPVYQTERLGSGPLILGAAAAMNAERFYYPELDSLRFFAFLAVYWFHCAKHLPSDAPALVRSIALAGGYGVDLFFLLSAYLITQLLQRERQVRGELSITHFWARRVFRIWPLYFLFLGLGVLLGFAGQPRLEWRYVLAFAGLSGNWVCALYGLPPSVIFPLWSVSVEEQFYLVWPLVVRRASSRTLLHIAIGLLVLGNVSRFALAGRLGDGIGFLTFVRIDAIACGIMLAVLLGNRRPSLAPPVRIAAFVAGFAVWVTVASAFTEGTPQRWSLGYPLVVTGAATMFCAVLGATNRVTRGRALTYLGRISYGLYVFHILALQLALACAGRFLPGWIGFAAFFACGLGGSILLAALSFSAIERPFLVIKARYSCIQSGSPEMPQALVGGSRRV